MRAVFVLCVLPMLCLAVSSKQHHVHLKHKEHVAPEPKVKSPVAEAEEALPAAPEPVVNKILHAQIGGHYVSICTHDHAANLAIIVLFTDKTKATHAFCPNEHVVTIISLSENLHEATEILAAIPDVAHLYGGGGGAHRTTLMGEGASAHLVWRLLQDPAAHDLYRNVVFYDVVPGLYNVYTNLDALPAKRVVFGLSEPSVAAVPDDEDVEKHDRVIDLAAEFLAEGDDRLLRTLRFFYATRPTEEVVQDVLLFRGVMKGLGRIVEQGGQVYYYEGGKHQEKLTEALLMFALTGTPGFLSTEQSWLSFDADQNRMYLDLSGSEASFREGWRYKNSLLWNMIIPTLPELRAASAEDMD